MRRGLVIAALGSIVFADPSSALDLNSFRAQHGRLPLSPSGELSGAAYSHAQRLAGLQRLDHAGFRRDTEDCAIRKWAGSGRHRANMLRRDVTSYGIASAVGSDGRRYWVLE